MATQLKGQTKRNMINMMSTNVNFSKKNPHTNMFDSDLCVEDFVASDYHALVLPGHCNFA